MTTQINSRNRGAMVGTVVHAPLFAGSDDDNPGICIPTVTRKFTCGATVTAGQLVGLISNQSANVDEESSPYFFVCEPLDVDAGSSTTKMGPFGFFGVALEGGASGEEIRVTLQGYVALADFDSGGTGGAGRPLTFGATDGTVGEADTAGQVVIGFTKATSAGSDQQAIVLFGGPRGLHP